MFWCQGKFRMKCRPQYVEVVKKFSQLYPFSLSDLKFQPWKLWYCTCNEVCFMSQWVYCLLNIYSLTIPGIFAGKWLHVAHTLTCDHSSATGAEISLDVTWWFLVSVVVNVDRPLTVYRQIQTCMILHPIPLANSGSTVFCMMQQRQIRSVQTAFLNNSIVMWCTYKKVSP